MERIEDCISFLLGKAYQQVQQASKRRLAPHGVTPVQYALLSSDNRALAAVLMAHPSVRAVSLRGDHLDVQVDDLGSFAVSLPGLAKEHDVTLYELSPSDESLESVFAYLVAR